ncbi:helix-turn-helix domain-containing protein [Vibrio sp. Of7-15]|uniref:helix-turn-helix domain-containing protein n=1 Tax=Vibrio sp. Of7-15 TaxID=2724879 RepID=UPI001EF2304D|nr:helix-turn-helix transcriptional regulator [Vibrio sp. Of7-15]MCG7499359.1 helix-turn-helix domain-containing protein [Vibrio sp. Of7-15]
MPGQKKEIDPIVLFLIQERLRQRKTQKVIAHLTGIEYRMIQRLEQGSRPIDICQIRLLCKALNIPFSHIALHEAMRESQHNLLQSLPANIRSNLIELIASIHQELENHRT